MRVSIALCVLLAFGAGIAVSQTRRQSPRRSSRTTTTPSPAPTPTPVPEVDWVKLSRPPGSTPTPTPTPLDDPFAELVHISIGQTDLYRLHTIQGKIRRQADGTVKIWVTKDPLPGKLSDVWQMLREEKVPYDPTKYRYSLMLWRIKCADRLLSLEARVEYGPNDEVLLSKDWATDAPDWRNAIPDSIGEGIVNAACKQP